MTTHRSRRQSRAALAVLGALALSAAACGSGRHPRYLGPPPDTATYQSAVQEELGAVVAILVDTSGSMKEAAPGDGRPKHLVAREAIEQILAATDEFVARRPDFPIKLTVFGFSSSPVRLLPPRVHDRGAVSAALDRLPAPGGGTAIGEAMAAARPELYRAGVFRKYMLVVTDGENTSGRDPARVAAEIHRKSQGDVSVFFVAFDTDPAAFSFLKASGGDVLAASDAAELRSALAEIYQGRILAEAVDYGEGPPRSVADQERSTR